MRSIKSPILVGIAAFAATLALGVGAQHASAAFRRVHSAECHSYNDAAGTGLYNGAYMRASSGSYSIYCPAPSDSELPHGSTATLNVHGYEPSGASVYSRACAQNYNSSGASCGTSGYWGSGYNGAYGVSTSAWTSNGAGMPYVYTYLPQGARLHGFFMAD